MRSLAWRASTWVARAREDAMVFPGGYYYELTKAMASLEAERALLYRGLPVVHLCPSIVIGDQRTGNNRGDTKVVNAPVNLFGRTHEALEEHGDGWLSRSKAAILARFACVFPGDPSAEINLIPVDWVAAGILATVHRPDAAGERATFVPSGICPTNPKITPSMAFTPGPPRIRP